MSRFSEIEAFIEVATQGSFTRAAEALNLSRSRLSQLVLRLENRLDTQLMERTTRTLALTAEGELFLKNCRQGMNQLASAEANLKLMSQQLSGPVRINSVGGIYGETYLSQALSEIMAQHPELSVTINYTSALVDLNKDPVDLVMRIGHAPAERVSSAFLGDVHHTLCASPAFVHRFGIPETPEELLNLPTICGTPKIWELEHLKSAQKKVITPNASWRSANTQAQTIAVEAGLGVGRLLSRIAEPKMKTGTLVPLLPDWRIEPTSLWLMWKSEGTLPKRIETVKAHLMHRLQQISDAP